MLGRRRAVKERINTQLVERILTFNGSSSAVKELFDNTDEEEKLFENNMTGEKQT